MGECATLIRGTAPFETSQLHSENTANTVKYRPINLDLNTKAGTLLALRPRTPRNAHRNENSLLKFMMSFLSK